MAASRHLLRFVSVLTMWGLAGGCAPPAAPVPDHVLHAADAGRVLPPLEAGDSVTVRLEGGPWRLVAAPPRLMSPIGAPRRDGEAQVFAFRTHAAGRGQLVFAGPGQARLIFDLDVR